MFVTATHFGRHATELSLLKELVNGKDTFRVLDFGPGLSQPQYYHELLRKEIELSSKQAPKFCWEPYEIANALQQIGVDYRIDLVDPNDLVTDALRKQDKLILEHHPRRKESYYPTKEYYQGFFPSCQRQPLDEKIYDKYQDAFQASFEGAIINLPQGIREKIHIYEDDLDFPAIHKGQYDLVFCWNVACYTRFPEEKVSLFANALNIGGNLFFDIGTPTETKGLSCRVLGQDNFLYTRTS
ncbi:MAG: hypothetical protein HGA85_01485 [Nanoarchaeota archaeon]|nr:hypothetical protein [Nanoarchaeota archaeon]